jgi:uncharacterized membrane protein
MPARRKATDGDLGPGELLTYKAAAELLTVKVTTVKALAQADEIDRIYIGTGNGRPRIVRKSIVAYLDRQFAAAATHGPQA